MRPRRELIVGLLLATAVVARAVGEDKPAPTAAPAKPQPGLLGPTAPQHSKEPITITSDNLEYQYKDGIIIYRGDVLAVQGEIKVRSNELHITLQKSDDPANGGKASAAKAADDLGDTDTSKVQEVIATGSVRIDQGTRWAVGGKATFDQLNRTLVLTENPVLHDGPNEVAGDRVIVYLDEDRSIVEGGRKRVKAVLFPSNDTGKPAGKDGATPGGTNAARPDGLTQARPPAAAQ